MFFLVCSAHPNGCFCLCAVLDNGDYSMLGALMRRQNEQDHALSFIIESLHVVIALAGIQLTYLRHLQDMYNDFGEEEMKKKQVCVYPVHQKKHHYPPQVVVAMITGVMWEHNLACMAQASDVRARVFLVIGMELCDPTSQCMPETCMWRTVSVSGMSRSHNMHCHRLLSIIFLSSVAILSCFHRPLNTSNI